MCKLIIISHIECKCQELSLHLIKIMIKFISKDENTEVVGMIGTRIVKLRKNRGMTQQELGKILGVSPSTIGMYEQNRRNPGSKMLAAIAEVFGVSTDFLLDESDKAVDTTVSEKKFQLFVERIDGSLVISDHKITYKTSDGSIRELTPHEATSLIQEISSGSEK